MKVPRRVGILTGGGDAPGLNAVIESCVRVLLREGVDVVGIKDGFDGLLKRDVVSLRDPFWGLHAQAGTYLGTSNKSRIEGKEGEFLQAYRSLELDGLIACGGDGTFATLQKFYPGISLIGIPKTIDNDVPGTEISFGFDTACAVVAESADALRFTAQAHRRIFVIETMGRDAGWIALGGALASIADAVLIPERPFRTQELYEFIRKRKEQQRGLIIVVAEGVLKKHNLMAESWARLIESETGWEARHMVLGHLQRSRQPTTTDRFLTISSGVKAAELVLHDTWNKAVVFRQGRMDVVTIEALMGERRLVPEYHPWISQAKSLGMFI